MKDKLVFRPDRALLEATERQWKKSRGWVICAPIEFLAVFFMLYKAYRSVGIEFEKFWYLFKTRATGSLLFFAFLLIGCVVQFAICLPRFLRLNRQRKNLAASYLELSDTELRGVSFASAKAEPTPFAIPLREITRITTGLTLNVMIYTKDATYACYQLERAPWVARQIEEAIERCKNA